MKRPAKRKTLPPPTGPRHKDVQRYTLLLCYSLITRLLFVAACLCGPGLAAAALLIRIVLGPPLTVTVEGGWVGVILGLVLVGPLYYLRRYVDRRFLEAKHQLEEIGLPDSARADQSEKTNPRSPGD